jgi:hypothetical protein
MAKGVAKVREATRQLAVPATKPPVQEPLCPVLLRKANQAGLQLLNRQGLHIVRDPSKVPGAPFRDLGGVVFLFLFFRDGGGVSELIKDTFLVLNCATPETPLPGGHSRVILLRHGAVHHLRGVLSLRSQKTATAPLKKNNYRGSHHPPVHALLIMLC